jgi:putative ABC transport system permease protein
MRILRFYRRTRFFLLINITGLAIGFAVSIMLLLFIVNELSYDRHFADKERIVRLVSILEGKPYSISLRRAYTELPQKVPGIEAATQFFRYGNIDVVVEQNTFRNLNLLYTDNDFFSVFQMKFIEGVPTNALTKPNSTVITRRYADIMFGSAANAIGNQILTGGSPVTVSGVVEELPAHTHFSFDILMNLSESWAKSFPGLEYHTYYLIDSAASPEDVRKNIETEYISIIKNRFAELGDAVGGYTEKLTDVYFSKALHSGKSNSMEQIWLLSAVAALILLLAVTNFINLFVTQGERRMKETGIRKANGAGISDIVMLFFTEVTLIVFIAFVLGFGLSIYLTPFLSELIHTEVDFNRLISPAFTFGVTALFIVTVTLSAGYPAFYLSRFSPLDILFKRVKFSKRRLTAGVVVFQSVITLVLLSCILAINRQTKYLENISKGYNPENVVSVRLNRQLSGSYDVLKQRLMQFPYIRTISGSDHLFGGGCSGQGIALLTGDKDHVINEYRVMPELCELMGLQLAEGAFLGEADRRDTIRAIIINEAAVRMLGMEQPVAGQYVNYKGDINTRVAGVVRDFYYDMPSQEIQPLVISFCFGNVGANIYIKYDGSVSRSKIMEMLNSVFAEFDPNFLPEPKWSEDVYAQKFESMRTQSKIILLSALLSLFIVILGLFAIHLYASIRRTKEIALRRIHGAEYLSIFILLSSDTIKWIAVATIIALPVEYYIISQWLENYANRTSLGVGTFLLPVLIQCTVALAISFGLTVRALSQNPANVLKSE